MHRGRGNIARGNFRGRSGKPSNQMNNSSKTRYFNQPIPDNRSNNGGSGYNTNRNTNSFRGRNMNRSNSLPRPNNLNRDNNSDRFDNSRNNFNRSFDMRSDRQNFESNNQGMSVGRFEDNQRNSNNYFSLENMRRSPVNTFHKEDIDDRPHIFSNDNRLERNVSNPNSLFDRRDYTRPRENSTSESFNVNDLFGLNNSRGFFKSESNSNNQNVVDSHNNNHNFNNSQNSNERKPLENFCHDRNIKEDYKDTQYRNEDSGFNNQINNRNQGFSNNRGDRNQNDSRYFGPRPTEKFSNVPVFYNKPILGLNNMRPSMPADNRPKAFIPYEPVLRFARSSVCDIPRDFTTGTQVIDNVKHSEPDISGNIMQRNPVRFGNIRERRGNMRGRRGGNRDVADRIGDALLGRIREVQRNEMRRGRRGAGKYSGRKKSLIKDQVKGMRNRDESIVIDNTSDEDEDCIIEVPVTPPPLVLIDDESDYDDDDENKKLSLDSASQSQTRNTPGRVISPTSSIVSDDFIHANDRQRVTSECFSTPQDDDLEGQPTVESFVNSKSRSKSKELEIVDDHAKFVHPGKYTVTDVNSRPTDVYESESSDQWDSIYQRPHKRRKSVSNDSSSDSRTKKNKKRQRSTSVGNVQTGDTSDDGELVIDEKTAIESSEDDDDESIQICPPPPAKTNLPFIKRGAALENNSNDDFAAILSNIIEGKDDDDIDEINKTQSSDDETREIESNINKKIREIDLTLTEEISKSNKTQNEIPLVDEETNIGMNVSWDGDILSKSTTDRGKTIGSKNHNKSDTEIDYSNRANRFSHLRCRNCNEKGHLKKHCKQPVKIICHMCGQSGHKDGQCPHKVCLNCGSSTNTFCKQCVKCRKALKNICRLCKMKGHYPQNCPDLWRRYHSTTNNTKNLTKNVEYSKVRHCSVCTNKGHLAEHCKHAQRFLTLPMTSSHIFSHDATYETIDLVDDNSQEPVPVSTKRKSLDSENSTTNSIRKKIRINDQEFEVIEEIAGDEEGKLAQEKSSKLFINPFAKKIDKRKSTTLDDFSFSKEMQKLNESSTSGAQSFVLSFITDSSEEINKTIDDPSIEAGILRSDEVNKNDNVKDGNDPKVTEEDSNYSFSEFYDKEAKKKDVNPDNDKSEPQKSKSLSPAPDFIAISNNDEPEEDDGQCHISLNEATDTTSLTEAICTAKIYLSKEDSQIILSPSFANTMKSLVLSSNVAIKMKHQPTGHILLITGKTSEQDYFHKQLLESVQSYKHENRRKHLEQSLQVPKAKSVLLKFIDNNLDMLKINLGNVNSLYRKMIYNERNNSKQSIKNADKARRILNMILMGQCGLRDGKMHLDALRNIREDLCKSDELHITTELRNAIFQHIKYVFSPFEHPNYDVLVEEYFEIKSQEKDQSNESENIEEPANDLKQTSNAESESPKKVDDDKRPSDHWSRRCEEVVEKCLKMLNIDDNKTVLNKLERVKSKAAENKLNNLDYQALMQIFNAIKARNS